MTRAQAVQWVRFLILLPKEFQGTGWPRELDEACRMLKSLPHKGGTE